MRSKLFSGGWVCLGASVALVAVLVPLAHASGSIEGVVIAVEDGDTLTVARRDGQHVPVRLSLVDAPEVCHRQHDPDCTKRPGQPYGDAAGLLLRSMVMGKVVRLQCAGKSFKRDVCAVSLAGRDIGLELVYRGAAWYSPFKSNRSSELQAAELAAKLSGRGLWSLPTPIRPADWRRGCWNDRVCVSQPAS